MQVPPQMPTGVQWHPKIGYSRFLKNLAPKHLLGGTLRTELRIDDKRYRTMPACQGGGCKQLGARCLDALLNFHLGVIGDHEPEERCQPQAMNGRRPMQPRVQMGPVVAKISREE